MTRKHFEAIAAIINDRSAHDHPMAEGERKGMADSLADYFGSQNPNFDHARFMAACGF